MKSSIRTVCPVFNTDRMVHDYAERFYLPASERARALRKERFRRARELAAWDARVREQWPDIAVESVETSTNEDLEVGAALRVTATVRLGQMRSDEVTVQLFHGPLDATGRLQGGSAITMGYMEPGDDDKSHVYAGAIPCRTSGRHGFSVRVLPHHSDLVTAYLPGLIRWG
jgi:starch phosphorylase